MAEHARPGADRGGSVKAEGLGDGPAHGKVAIAKLRLTLPPTMLGDFAFTSEVVLASVDDAGGHGI